MLTADLAVLGVGPGSTLLDMGCGGGRHAFAALRRGATVVAFDADGGELKQVQGTMVAMQEAGELPAGAVGTQVQGDALALPFADASFDRIIAAEVLEHIPDDVAAIVELARVLTPGGRMAVTVPARLPERVNWLLDDDYHDFPGGHIRIYRQAELEGRLSAAGLRVRGSQHAHALHSPYWWLKCAVGPTNDDNPLVQAYLKLLTWDIMAAPKLTRWTEKALNPVLGKSLVLYARKPAKVSEAVGG